MEIMVSERKHLYQSVGSKTMGEYVLKSGLDVPMGDHVCFEYISM